MVEVLWGRGGIVVIEGWKFELKVEADTFCSGVVVRVVVMMMMVVVVVDD